MSASHRSPKKLQRSIHNQLLSLPSNSHLSFSRSNLLPTHHTLPAIISQFQLHSTFITSLDCHFSILNKASVSTFCQCLVNLEELKLVDCRLKELDPTTSWPIRLRCIDFSRNQLTKCPQGLASLVYLTTLNLSGNLIQQLDPALLRLPLLEKLYLVQNPVQNIPKCVCREGVGRMREYFKVEPLPPPKPYPPLSNSSLIRLPNSRKTLSSVCDFEKCHDLRRLLLRQRGSFDSDYESTRRCRSTSNSSIDTCDSDNSAGQIQCPLSEHFQPPSGYSPAAATNLCQIYLPEGCEDNICVELVKDLSLYPKLESNELLVTPVVQITPHGRRFSAEQPAIIWLPHCTKSNVVIGDGHDVMFKQELVPVCSDSGLHQPTTWGKLGSEHCCEMFSDHVIFRTTHFSLFAVVSILPYPSASISVGPNYGGTLTVAELPGFEVNLPPSSSAEGLTVTATVYYDDAPYNIESNDRTLASPCVGLEPHGAQFDKPVQITLPIPNYPEILSHFQDAKLELWHATPSTTQRGMSAPPNPENWELFRNGDISIGERDGIHVLIFTTNHFSWWETLWDIGRRALQRIGLTPTVDVSRTRYVSVRVQALMSPPVRVGVLGATTDIQTFGLLVAVYKFGAPLTQLSNYPWSLLDTGSKRIYLQLGQLEVSVQGYFSAMEYEDPTSPLSRSAELIEFNGDDFCQRFEFALQLKPGYEVCDGMLIGKLHFKQWSGSNPSHKNYNLVIESGPAEPIPSSTRQPLPLSLAAPLTPCQQPPLLINPDFTPPWSPESDTQMESEVFLNEPSSSGSALLHNSAHSPSQPRKRPLSVVHTPNHPSYGNHSGGAKRRLLCRQGDIDERTLLRVADAVGSKYTELGIELGLTYKWIQSNIENKGSMTRDNLKALCVLHEWRSRAGEEFTYSELAKALEADQIGLRSVANQICYTTS